jgi:hypothetical protein
MISRIVAVVALIAASMPADSGAGEARIAYSPVEYLKNFALSVCISDGYASKDVVKDSLAAAGAYSELGSLPFEAYENAERLAKQFLARKYTSISGEQLTLMKCIDLFHSKELDRLARTYRGK